jgi:hypothetical protein
MDASQECLDRLAVLGQVVTEHLDEPLVPAQVPAGQVEVEAADPRRDHGQAEPGPDSVEVGRQRRQLELSDRHGSELGEQRDVSVRPAARLGSEHAQGTAGTTVGVDERAPRGTSRDRTTSSAPLLATRRSRAASSTMSGRPARAVSAHNSCDRSPSELVAAASVGRSVSNVT